MSDHGEPRFDIQMRCMCAPFSTTRSQTCTSGFKVSVTVLQLGNRPYITIFSTKKTHLQDYTSQTPGNTPSVHTHTAISISIHEHNHLTTQTPQVYVSVRTYLMSSLSFLFSLPLFLTMSLTIIFSGQKQPSILHLPLSPDEAAALSLSSLSRSSTSAHLRSFSFVPHALLMCSDARQVRCSSGKPTPVTLHSHCFQTYMYMYHSTHAHHKIPHLFNHILTCS